MFSGAVRISIVMFGMIALTVISSPAVVAKSDRPSLGLINIGMGKSDVLNRLGKPLRSSRRGCARDESQFSKGIVGTQDGTVYYIIAQSRGWETKKGIRVGDNISSARAVYNLKKTADSKFEVALSSGESIYFDVNTAKKIKRIELREIRVC
jgi:hypothetical protein